MEIMSSSIRSNVTGQHDWQDERLTGQLPNLSEHCPLTGRYFDPCFPTHLSEFSYSSSNAYRFPALLIRQ